MIIEGVISLEHMHQGTKSEGLVAFLTDEGGKRYRLYRPGVYEAGDSFFASYDKQSVGVEGEIEQDKFIAVDSIVVADIARQETAGEFCPDPKRELEEEPETDLQEEPEEEPETV